MSIENSSGDPDISVENFRNCGWRGVLSSIERKGYFEIFKVLFSTSQQKEKDGNIPQGKIFKLLAYACSLVLQPEQYNEPFRPRLIGNGEQTTIPNDYSDEIILFFATIVEEIENMWLRARLADLVWLIQKPRELRFALIAIDAYRAIPINTQTWLHGADVCWERGLRLAILLGRGAENRVEEMKGIIIKTIVESKTTDGFLAHHLSILLEKTELHSNPSEEIARQLESLGMSFKDMREINKSNTYFSSAVKWYGYLKQEEKVVEMLIKLAENFVTISRIHLSGEEPNYAVSAMFLEKAIHSYRRIPHKYRLANKIDERIDELHMLMIENSSNSLGQMKRITSSVDVTDLVEKACKEIAGKSLDDALAYYCNIYPGIDVSKLRQDTEEYIQQNPILTLFPSTSIHSDGRVVAKRPGGVVEFKEDEKSKKIIWAEMIKNYLMQIGLVVQANLLPALKILTLEHRITEYELINITINSPMVPPDREYYFTKGFLSGFEYDFITSLHILIPQIEHIVRWHLKQNGIKTTALDANGIEYEYSLNTLLDIEQVNTIFGENLIFELKAILIDGYGPALRHLMAHGLLDYKMAYNFYTVYIWWLTFKIVYNTSKTS